jgi:mono/diheme cytochrome c family protein
MKTIRENGSAVHNEAGSRQFLRRVSAIRRRTLVAMGVAAVVGAGGALMLRATPANVHPTQGSKPATKPSGNAENGRRLFTKYGCYECHDYEGQGSSAGPRVGPNPVPFEVFSTYLRKPTGEMPPYTDKLVSDEELADIYAFLQSLPHPPDAKTIPILNK